MDNSTQYSMHSPMLLCFDSGLFYQYEHSCRNAGSSSQGNDQEISSQPPPLSFYPYDGGQPSLFPEKDLFYLSTRRSSALSLAHTCPLGLCVRQGAPQPQWQEGQPFLGDSADYLDS
jgi:hypothetical protein